MRHVHLGSGHTRYVPKHLLHIVAHHQRPHHLLHGGAKVHHIAQGEGYAGPHKRDIGSMKSVSGAGVKHHKKVVPLRFKL